MRKLIEELGRQRRRPKAAKDSADTVPEQPS
jgi:hypothetical protein